MNESKLENKFFKYLHKKNSNVYLQVPFISRIIDIVEVTKNGRVITYELKISNWGKALEQIRNHSIASHFSYLCMPQNKVGKKKLEALFIACKKESIGLILWDEEINAPQFLLKAKSNQYRNKYATKKLKENISKL